MASDISNIIKSEISSTLESLLSVSSKVEEVTLLETELDEQQCIKVGATFEFSGKSSNWNFFIPTGAATQFEYLMLGGVSDLKESIDEEITDAVKEIASTISGSIVTSINAQGFGDISGVKFTLADSSVAKCSEIADKSKAYKFTFSLNSDKFDLIIAFDDTVFSYLGGFNGGASGAEEAESSDLLSQNQGAGNSIINTILGEESVDNLKLLFDIRMRLSVRLGTKVCLLRDVISWDIGEIIELSQMTNEPLDILVNGVVIGKGEAIIVDGKFGVKIKTIGNKKSN